ncbi:FYVE and coiled-coil domain-containing protein 1 isoform X2 [Trichomycterus rosablanca]|uniref:FYVE and coiled-coil domain-containing protein 1 isoform X2 n=1 Tax=Trichomycterus rosablanca TaxID=2290929 RepID=UPI002F35F8C7
MASVTVGESQLQRIIRDLHDAVSELIKEHQDSGEPITDDCDSLHKFSYKLEYLLQFDQKEKTTFLGSRKDYWDYFCECLAKIKGANDGIRFVKSISELKTSLGKGRAFIRYCLVHQRLADTLQQCLMNQRVTCDWYYARSPFLKSQFNVDIINHLYELNGVQFDVASRGYDLDSEWPTFARRTLGSVVSASHVWKPPSRCSSVNSLVSNFSQQAQEFHQGPDLGTSLTGDSGEQELALSDAEGLRIELDQSELSQRRLQEKVHLLQKEVGDLQEKLLAAESDRNLKKNDGLTDLSEKPNDKKTSDGTSSKKGEQVEKDLKIEELLSKLKLTEVEKLEAKRESEDRSRQAEKLAQQLKTKEEKLKETEEMLAQRKKEDGNNELLKVDELQATVNRLQEELSLKQEEMQNLRTQLKDLRSSFEARGHQLEDIKKKVLEERQELQQKSKSLKESLDCQILSLQEQLKRKEMELSVSTQKIQQLESQSKKLDEYKAQCTSLMENNAKLVHTLKKSEDSTRELVETRAALEKEVATLRASEKQLISKLDSSPLTVEEKKKLLEENQTVKGNLQKAKQESELNEEQTKSLEKQNKDLQACTIEKQGGSEDHKKDSNLDQHFKPEEASSHMALVVAQLELNMKEVSRLQEEVIELRAQLQVTSEEKMKLQALQEVTEASLENFCAQTEQLKSQVEELNRRHVEELLRCRESEEALEKELKHEAQVQANLQAQAASMKEELQALRSQNSTLLLETEEFKEALDRANTETAQLGVQVCVLSGQNEEASLHGEELLTRLKELEEMHKEEQNLRDSVQALTKENAQLTEELKQKEGLSKITQELKQRLNEAREESMSLRRSHQKEVNALRLQLDESTTNLQNQIKALNEELLDVRSQMKAGQEKASPLETRLAELEAINISLSKEVEEKNACVLKSDALLQQKEEELNQIRGNFTRAQEKLASSQKACQDLGENLRKKVQEQEMFALKASAEVEDLCRTKKNLEERLIELIREKDVLWKKSDALEFEQKLRAEESDRELPYCFECHAQFSWWLRRHNCRLCGRPFCYSCCTHVVSSQQGGTKERCCKECFTRHSTAERHSQGELGSPSQPSHSPLASTPTRTSMPSVTVALRSPRLDDAAFDVITDEEVNWLHESDSLPYTTALSPGSMQHGTHDMSSSTSGGDLTADESEDLPTSAQDAEICLLKSGELTLYHSAWMRSVGLVRKPKNFS